MVEGWKWIGTTTLIKDRFTAALGPKEGSVANGRSGGEMNVNAKHLLKRATLSLFDSSKVPLDLHHDFVPFWRGDVSDLVFQNQ